MPGVAHILVPVDFSPPSHHAMAFTRAHAARLGATRITLLHVDAVPTYGLPDGGVLDQELRDKLRRRLETLVEAMRREVDPTIEVAGRVVRGVPHRRIVEAAGDADLLVLGTHGRTGLGHLLLGSVAERVLRLSPKPTVTVPPPGRSA
jgi:nucleotide-binding universal stress UspA family protein